MSTDPPPLAPPLPVVIECQRQGGLAFPLRRPKISVEVADLDEAERQALQRLMQAADMAEQPADYPRPGYPDALETQLTVTWPGHSASVRFRDGDGHPAPLDELAGWVLRHKRTDQEKK
ncbi:protealysin inhibitor emfourin [Nitrospirillum sp. BR 11828]|uniref:protealysin inhibitor emfourin n=1 Tax=Nitrospirillum sp. BR 11828 TaxID=3104325 RepID=UPI002ACA37E9|nr:protealysin inhibitor emfourin [Nitrospirillum sp. BR 11828]MDZ5648843.1 protealysin inhibitor emfourin [Nitrospirillum sp. BR 11828]